jgi:hypothetical protein
MNQLFKSLIGKAKYTFGFVFFLISHSFLGQNNITSSKTEFYKIISFGESIKVNKVDTSSKWIIESNDLGLHIELTGSEINSYVFDTPGNYEITFSEANHAEDTCNHSSIPEQFNVFVSPTKMMFDFSTLAFNKKIEAGISLDNIEITLNVNLKTYNNDSVLFENGQMVSAGIGTTISGKLMDDKVKLKPGINKLTYKISGSATKDTYIMFDFFDINNQVQSYYFPTKL